MNRAVNRSVLWRLLLGLGGIGVAGALALGLLVAREYGFTIDMMGDAGSRWGVAIEFRDHVLFPLLILIVPMALAATLVIQRSLAPLDRAARAVDAAGASERGFRIEATELPREALPFVASVNALLDRLDCAARDQEGFAADVAHELRTPLSVLALEAERLDGPVGERLRADILAMRRLIEQLMVLAQLDADAAARQPRTLVELADVAADVAALLAPSAIANGCEIAVESSGDTEVSGRREAIGAAVRNLAENGLRVTPRGGTVTLRTGPGPVITVEDGGPGLSIDRLSLLRNRHGRGAHASQDGAGLGLAIVDRIAAAHGARLETSPESRSLRLCFPVAPARQDGVSSSL